MKKLSLSNAKNTLSRKEMKAISGGYGGFLGIFCITGVLDGIRHNTHFNWGSCR
jgi:hypothetical protein